MKTLIIHPEDPTTTFLSRIYARLKDKTVVRGGINKSDLQELIESHDRVILLGHGSPYGLLSRGQFTNSGLYIINESMVSSLKKKSNSIFIWCYADQFVQRHQLAGLNTGMFISEMGESNYWEFEDIDRYLIDQSNERFAFIVSRYITEPMEVLYHKLVCEYEPLAKTNPIARFNLERIYLTCLKSNKNPKKKIILEK